MITLGDLADMLERRATAKEAVAQITKRLAWVDPNASNYERLTRVARESKTELEALNNIVIVKEDSI